MFYPAAPALSCVSCVGPPHLATTCHSLHSLSRLQVVSRGFLWSRALDHKHGLEHSLKLWNPGFVWDLGKGISCFVDDQAYENWANNPVIPIVFGCCMFSLLLYIYYINSIIRGSAPCRRPLGWACDQLLHGPEAHTHAYIKIYIYLYTHTHVTYIYICIVLYTLQS